MRQSLGSKRNPDPDRMDPMTLLGEKREPILFPSKKTVSECFGLEWPVDLDLNSIMGNLGPGYEGNVISLFLCSSTCNGYVY
jgi:hypothetical protein